MVSGAGVPIRQRTTQPILGRRRTKDDPTAHYTSCLRTAANDEHWTRKAILAVRLLKARRWRHRPSTSHLYCLSAHTMENILGALVSYYLRDTSQNAQVSYLEGDKPSGCLTPRRRSTGVLPGGCLTLRVSYPCLKSGRVSVMCRGRRARGTC